MNEADGEAKNRTTAATSSGVPQRANSDSFFARTCQYDEAPSAHLVLIHPGATQLTRTSGANDRARLLENAITAPFMAANNSPLSPPMPSSTRSQPILTIAPDPRAVIRRPIARDKD